MHNKRNYITLGTLLALAAISMTARLVYHNPSLHFDECYHALTAQSILTDGDLAMRDGARPYNRGAAFSYMVAGSIKFFGNSVTAMRLPATVAGVLLVLLIVEWLRKQTNLLAAAIVGMMLAISLHSINNSVFMRFYTVHALLTLLCVIFLYATTLPGLSHLRRGICLIAAIVVGASTMHFQVIGVLPIGFASLWVASCLLLTFMKNKSVTLRIATLCAGLAIVIGIAYIMLGHGPLQPLWHSYRWSAIWSENVSDDAWYYWRHYSSWYGWMWYAFPLAIVAAATRWPRMTVFNALLYVGAMYVMSYGAMKSHRYTFMVQPFFWCVWAMATASILQWFYAGISHYRPQWKPAARGAGVALIALIIAAPLGWKVREFKDSAMMLMQGKNYPYKPFAQSEWSDAAAQLCEIESQTDALVTSVNAKAIFYLGEPGYTLSATLTEERDEFDNDPRFAAPVFKSLDSLKQVITEHTTGLIIVEEVQWRTNWSVSNDICDYIESTMTPIELPKDYKLRVFTWNTAAHKAS